ncbi:hypothetical protein GLI01_36100 [Gluconacetobacter liquefaciens]|nr:hypothetical protein AA0522_0671 [Gluconacetobacter liquefaciens NRIC 0522]GEB39575.1 hypothetical protein GLI01_36100 [Gluconacetobacter liquefaciens]
MQETQNVEFHVCVMIRANSGANAPVTSDTEGRCQKLATSTVYAHAKNFADYYTSPYYSSPSGAPLAEKEFAAYSRR